MVTHGKRYEADEHRASLEIPGEELSDATHTFLGREGSPKKAKEQARLLGGLEEELKSLESGLAFLYPPWVGQAGSPPPPPRPCPPGP